MAVSLLIAASMVTCRPCLANSPSCWAMYQPAVSSAGTMATVRFDFSTLPGAADPLALAQPAASREATAATAENRMNRQITVNSPPKGLNRRTKADLGAELPCHAPTSHESESSHLCRTWTFPGVWPGDVRNLGLLAPRAPRRRAARAPQNPGWRRDSYRRDTPRLI